MTTAAATTETHDGERPDTTAAGRFSVSNRIAGTLDPCVVETKAWMQEHAHLWEDDEHGIVSLAQGVVYWKPPPSCRTALVEAVLADSENDDNTTNENSDPLALHSYSPARGLPELVEALEAKIAIEHGMKDHDVTVTVGANQAYANIVLTLLGGGSHAIDNNKNNNNKAIVFAPYYFNHVMAIQMCAGPESVLVGPTDMTTGVPDLGWLRRTLSEHESTDGNAVRMVTLVNPGNPTGVALSKETVAELVDLCRDYGVWVVLDCTYEHFFRTNNNDDNTMEEEEDGTGVTPNPLPTFSDETHVIHVFSFSKGYAMAGYRCGYLVSHKNEPSVVGGGFLSQMLKVQDTIPIGPPRLSQHVALGALRQGADASEKTASSSSSSPTPYSPSSKEWVYQKYSTLDASRECILEALSALPQRIGGSGSMYVMGKLPDGLELTDVALCQRLVRDHGIAVIPGSFCGFPGWIRVCYANLPPERTKMAAERLREGLAALAATS